ncbi:hypothetical protein COLO4_00095 [Corchorus olitorius]|uniref:Uncharacterized protein n=1 Tax=Corchorus olitorius TaxID=93759 RepID=A0A1R3L4M6_9ROSI|nr:hypothetical protein COLO4_00095 [Corchorus olitorius]
MDIIIDDKMKMKGEYQNSSQRLDPNPIDLPT